ncbi:DUF2480 family protein [Aurantibacillus circumpalustris]|uniref:DUF2480 family protein n=1 Tax=Aurantibacillus circumpalustris TaxID=3036359 RepID=UPI00295B5D4C|nr:DUF2480 family protein [Aurantibacillus circumpalustris]
MDEIINKVAGSGIVSIDLEEFYVEGDRVFFDIKPHLFMEQILKEKDFREFLKTNDWSLYEDKIVGIICSADAIVPTWAYMLITLALEPHARRVFFGNLNELENIMFAEKLATINPEIYKDARVVIKGCGEKQIPTNAFVQLTTLLKPFAKSIMYGEPCSTVPLYKAKSS